MAVRTGTQLKTDQAAAASALATAIATPTEANINAAITAFETVRANGVDSLGIQRQPVNTPSTYAGNFPHTQTTTQTQVIAHDVANLARQAKRDLALVNWLTAALAQDYNTSADIAKELQNVRNSLEFGPWAQLRQASTTD